MQPPIRYPQSAIRNLLLALCFCASVATVHAQLQPARRAAIELSKRQHAVGGGGGGASTLNTSLIAYWKLDEASGNRADSSGANTLTDNNTVTSDPGKIGDAAEFVEANSENLSIADNAALSTGDIDFTYACWAYSASIPSVGILGSKGAEWYAYISAAGGGFVVFNTGGSDLTAAGGSFSPSAWHHVVVTFTASSNTREIFVDGSSVASGVGTAPADDAGDFRIGSYSNGGAFFMNGLIDGAAFWKKVLSGAEITELYNGGTGKTCCPF